MTTSKRSRSVGSQRGVWGLETGEARFRLIVIGLLLTVLPVILVGLYAHARFNGLTSAEAMDCAQIGRNMAKGHGFTTLILRPLALTHGTNPMQQPDLTHGPLYPLLLGVAMLTFGDRDMVIAGVSIAFFLLTVPLIYLLGVRVFNWKVGLIAALAFTFNVVLLDVAISGQSFTLQIFLFTCLLIVCHTIARGAHGDVTMPSSRPSPASLIAAGLLCGALYLADPLFFFVAPVMATLIALLQPSHKLQACSWFALAFGLLALPWIARNTMLMVNPILGLREAEAWMGARQYPGYYGYRLAPGETVQGLPLFNEVAAKILTGFVRSLQEFPAVAVSHLFVFLIPSLLFRATDRAADSIRRFLICCLLAQLAGSLVWGVTIPQFTALVSGLLVLSAAFMLRVIDQFKLSRTSLAFAGSLAALAAMGPVLANMTAEKQRPLREAQAARELRDRTRPDAINLSDQPWLAAWYAERPSIWLPASDLHIKTLRRQFPQTRWLFLTANAGSYSPAWGSIYNLLMQWDAAYLLAEREKRQTPEIFRFAGKEPLLVQALEGFGPTPPMGAEMPAATLASIVSSPASPSGQQKRSTGSAPVRQARTGTTGLE